MTQAALALILSVQAQSELDRLPPYDFSLSLWVENGTLGKLEYHYTRLSELGGTYSDWALPALHETRTLRELWGQLADAANPHCYLEHRLDQARRARATWDWQLYGWPPVAPSWRCPVWCGNDSTPPSRLRATTSRK
jgi:hypothetical protein